MATLTDMVDPFNGELSSFGYKLNNMYGFKVDKSDLQKLIDSTDGEDVHLGFNARIPNLVLRELSPTKLRLGLRLAEKMFEAKDTSAMSLIQLGELNRDLLRIESKLNDEKWMNQD